MNLKSIVLAFSVLSFLNVVSQEKIASFAGNAKNTKELFTVVDNATMQPTVFFVNDDELNATRFDKNLVQIDNLSLAFAKRDVRNILGNSNSGNQYYVYWTGAAGNEVISQHFDFDSKTTKSHKIAFDIEKERVIDNFTANNIFYVVTALKNTNFLHFYRFQNGAMDKKTIDVSSNKFLDRTQQKVTFYDLYTELSGAIYSAGIQSISADTPASIVLATNKKKSYVQGDSVIFTFDVNPSFTQALTVDLKTFAATQKTYSAPYIPLEPGDRPDSNSFLVNDILIQIKVKSDIMQLTAKKLDNTSIKSITLEADEEVSFKNSDIIQENGSIASTRILGSSNQLLRKMHNLSPAVSAHFIDDKYFVVLGGVSPPKQDKYVMIGGMVGGFAGAMIGAAISPNSTAANLNSYENKKIVYIQSVFDKDFKHVSGAYKKLAFDKLRLFIENNDKLKNHSIFKIGDDLYLLAFSNVTNVYSFYKFQD